MKKHDVGDDLGLRGLEKGQRKKTIQTWIQTDLGRTGTKSIENTRAHITAVRSCERTPDITDETNQRGEDQDRSSAVGSLNGDPGSLV